MILPILGALCLLGAAYFLLPLTMGVCHVGMFWPAALLVLLSTVFFFPRLWGKLPRKVKAVVITTGGLDSKAETITQGGCAAETLIAMGIDSTRVYAEEKSFDTRENLLFAAEIIEENNLDTHVVIASDNFHQLRGQIYAREAGLDPRAAGCSSPLLLGAGYACREVLGILAAVVGLE